MRLYPLLLAACLLQDSDGTPIGTQSLLQASLEDHTSTHHTQAALRPLQGRFLHITDIHPDPHYKIFSSTEEEDACHRGKGVAGTYGAETSDCDTPFALVNATFKWIEENIRDNVDFVVWTGDSARHDSDELIPRTQDEVLNTNVWIANKFIDVFSNKEDPEMGLNVPIISTFGNNDFLPHNILLQGPNKWLKAYTDIWSSFIPEEQRHGFERGGWYYVEVIPNKLAIFSLNTMYFFSHNAAVDGCSLRSEPGYEHMEWLRIQLQFMRQRGMKVILMGHVPPARTNSKTLWDETCWQKYTLWLHKYRDVIVGGLYGHMNVDHFVLQDTKEIDLLSIGGDPSFQTENIRTKMDDEFTIQSANDYLEELRESWSDLPNPKPKATECHEHYEVCAEKKKKKHKKSKKDKLYKKIGGPWGEKFQVTLVSPSIVPNYFPTLRIVEYNITGLDKTATWANARASGASQQIEWLEEEAPSNVEDDNDEMWDDEEHIEKKKKRKGKKPKKPKKPSNPDLIVPSPPTKGTPPGPAYSPQTLTLLGYTQYFANLTHINNGNFVNPDEVDPNQEDSGLEDVDSDEFKADKWHGGKHKGKKPKDKVPHPKPFQFQVEYDTFTDPVYKLKDLTVSSYLKLAHRIGQYKPLKGDEIDEPLIRHFDDDDENDEDEDDAITILKKHNKKKHHKQHEKNKVWLRFIRRAFVGTLEEDELQTFENPSDSGVWEEYTSSPDFKAEL